MDNKLCALVIVLALIVGGVTGALVFPKTVPVVTEKVVTVEKQVPVVTEKLVPQECPAPPVATPAPVCADPQQSDAFKNLNAEYAAALKKLQACSPDYISVDDLALDQQTIAKAKDVLANEYKYELLINPYTPSNTQIVKYTNEDATSSIVTRSIDGKYHDFKLTEAWFDVKVEYSNNDGIVYHTWHVDIKFDVDRDGNDDTIVTVDRTD